MTKLQIGDQVRHTNGVQGTLVGFVYTRVVVVDVQGTIYWMCIDMVHVI